MIDAGVARQHDDRHKRIGACRRGTDHLRQVETVHAFQHPVQKNDIGIGIAQDRPGPLAFGRFENLDCAERLKNRDDQFAHMRIVVDDENLQSVESIAAHARSGCAGRVPAPPVPVSGRQT
jgi:hypothetical protein